MTTRFILFCLFVVSPLAAHVHVGLERILTPQYGRLLQGKRVGLVTNHTAVTHGMKSSIDVLLSGESSYHYKLTALFAPEHGLTGSSHAFESVADGRVGQIPLFSLHGKTRRPTPDMLRHVDLLVYDIQDIGSRSYTYISTLFYVMEEAAKAGIPVIVLDRPNPINGRVVDGPMLDESLRSIVGYINVPYCHGMTAGELARFFNKEYRVGCRLKVVPMAGWRRGMTFADTGLPWIPTSPHIPEPSTTYYYPMTGILGELQIVNIGVGYTLPFKVVGAPWIDGEAFANKLNEQKLPGVLFHPMHYKPFYGKFAKEECHGIMIVINDPHSFRPVMTQYVIIGLLKSLYPQQFKEALQGAENRREMFAKVNGSRKLFPILRDKPYIAWELRQFHQKERQAFLRKREHYLIKEYGS